MHWVERQNKLEIPRDEDEVNKREIHECDVEDTRWQPTDTQTDTENRSPRQSAADHCLMT